MSEELLQSQSTEPEVSPEEQVTSSEVTDIKQEEEVKASAEEVIDPVKTLSAKVEELEAALKKTKDSLKMRRDKEDVHKEIMVTRKAKIEELQAKLSEYDALFKQGQVNQISNAEAIELNDQRKDVAAELKSEQTRMRLETNKQTIFSELPDFATRINDIVEVAREDGSSEEEIALFLKDPFNFDPAGVIKLAQKADRRKEVVKKTETLAQENARLKEELAKFKSGEANVLSNVSALQKEQGDISLVAKSSGSRTPSSYAGSSELSLAEMEAILKQK